MRKRVRLNRKMEEGRKFIRFILGRTGDAGGAEGQVLHAHGKLQLRHITCRDGKGRMIKVRNEGSGAS